ncbi:MAG: DUF3604 domain-containing protein [Armatimonadota bacterium]
MNVIRGLRAGAIAALVAVAAHMPTLGVGAVAQTLFPVMANLHSHTDYSDAVHQWLQILYSESASPADAFAYARWSGNLQVMAVTDHSELISPKAEDGQTEMVVLGKPLKHWHRTPDEWADTLRQAEQATVPGQFVALRGFEWSGDATDAHGHVNVIASADYTGAYGFVSGYAQDMSRTLSEFYVWLAGHGTAADGGTVVCQFNHPDSYASGGAPFGGLRLVPDMDHLFALIEIGNGYDLSVPLVSLEAKYSGPSANEKWYVKALDEGWHVAPAIGEDNHTGLYGKQTRRRTGLWVTELTPAGVMKALRARRAFATEDASVTAWLSAFEKYPMGSRDVPPSSRVRLKLRLESTKGVDVADAEVVTVGGTVVWRASETATPLPQVAVAEWSVEVPYASIKPVLNTRQAGQVTVVLDASGSHAEGPARETYYFGRIKQKDGDMLYTAPVWVLPATAWRPVQYVWRFGDGSPDYAEAEAEAPDGRFDGIAVHSFPGPGRYRVAVAVRGPIGDEAVVEQEVEVAKSCAGDVDGDGRIGVGDAVLSLRYALGIAQPEQEQLTRADLWPPESGGDGRITVADVVLILRAALGLW